MKSSALWQQVSFYQQSVTEQARRIGLGVVAAGWLFRTPEAGFPDLILLSFALAVLYFATDLGQYIWAGERRKNFVEAQEQRFWREHGTIDFDVDLPADLDRPIAFLFRLKVVLLAAACAALIAEIARVVFS